MTTVFPLWAFAICSADSYTAVFSFFYKLFQRVFLFVLFSCLWSLFGWLYVSFYVMMIFIRCSLFISFSVSSNSSGWVTLLSSKLPLRLINLKISFTSLFNSLLYILGVGKKFRFWSWNICLVNILLLKLMTFHTSQVVF